MTDTFRALCAELLDEIGHESPTTCLARAALSQPEPVEVTDEDLLCVAASSIEPYESCGIGIGEYEAETNCAVEAYGSELISYARAVLARWGRPALAPIPVTERLPGAEDCDADGRCWVHQPNALLPEAPGWMLIRSKYASANYAATCWLPSHALPLP